MENGWRTDGKSEIGELGQYGIVDRTVYRKSGSQRNGMIVDDGRNDWIVQTIVDRLEDHGGRVMDQLRGLTIVGNKALLEESLEEFRLGGRQALVGGALQLQLAGANGKREGIHRAAMKAMCSR